MTDAVWHQVRQISADIFNLPLEAVTLQSSADTIENWDSLQHVTLVLALEQTFNLQFRPEEIVEMLNIERIVFLVEKKLKEIQLRDNPPPTLSIREIEPAGPARSLSTEKSSSSR